ncbi:FAD/NAD(P)-binding domain-containing protein [Mycena olivaceomarginata]|nr:FAD/NAD(P)-binding domain-containing protein [Mycena olivaceomarginata]
MACTQNPSRPLNISIIGAGIGGLTAAIALRRNGHHVKIFEASQTKAEIGAGVGVQANALSILRQFGYSRENLKPANFDGTIDFDAKNGIGIPRPLLTSMPDGVHDSVFCHRNDLYDELKRLATGESIGGPPAQLLFNSKVVACDAEAGTVTLGNSEIIHADVVIGADGIHSIVRTSVVGHTVKPPALGLTCFRGLFDASNLNELEDLEWLTEGLNGARTVMMQEEELRMIFVYPCRNGSLINFVGHHTDPNQEAADWSPIATLEKVREKFADFHPKFLRVFDLPLHTPISKWQFLGQGAAMAIEEAAVLGCLLPAGTTKGDVPARLEAYQTLCKERGEFVSTAAVSEAAEPEKRGQYFRSREMQMSMLDYDAIKVAQEYYDGYFRAGVKI